MQAYSADTYYAPSVVPGVWGECAEDVRIPAWNSHPIRKERQSQNHTDLKWQLDKRRVQDALRASSREI